MPSRPTPCARSTMDSSHKAAPRSPSPAGRQAPSHRTASTSPRPKSSGGQAPVARAHVSVRHADHLGALRPPEQHQPRQALALRGNTRSRPSNRPDILVRILATSSPEEPRQTPPPAPSAPPAPDQHRPPLAAPSSHRESLGDRPPSAYLAHALSSLCRRPRRALPMPLCTLRSPI